MPEYLSQEEVLQQLEVRESELEALVTGGRLRPYHDAGVVKFRQEDVERLRAERRGQPTVIRPDASPEPPPVEPIDLAEIPEAASETEKTEISIQGDEADEGEQTARTVVPTIDLIPDETQPPGKGPVDLGEAVIPTMELAPEEEPTDIASEEVLTEAHAGPADAGAPTAIGMAPPGAEREVEIVGETEQETPVTGTDLETDTEGGTRTRSQVLSMLAEEQAPPHPFFTAVLGAAVAFLLFTGVTFYGAASRSLPRKVYMWVLDGPARWFGLLGFNPDDSRDTEGRAFNRTLDQMERERRR